MEKQGYVKSLMEHEDVREMVECERQDAREEGFNEGVKQGRAEGRAEVFASMLEHGFDVHMIAAVTGMTEEDILAIVRN